MRMMNKLVIVCSGKVKEAFNVKDGKAYDFLWNEDIESTWSYINQDSKGLSAVIIYGFEPIGDTINEILDNRKENSFPKFLNEIGVNVVKIKHTIVKSTEYEKERNEIETNK